MYNKQSWWIQSLEKQALYKYIIKIHFVQAVSHSPVIENMFIKQNNKFQLTTGWMPNIKNSVNEYEIKNLQTKIVLSL